MVPAASGSGAVCGTGVLSVSSLSKTVLAFVSSVGRSRTVIFPSLDTGGLGALRVVTSASVAVAGDKSCSMLPSSVPSGIGSSKKSPSSEKSDSERCLKPGNLSIRLIPRSR